MGLWQVAFKKLPLPLSSFHQPDEEPLPLPFHGRVPAEAPTTTRPPPSTQLPSLSLSFISLSHLSLFPSLYASRLSLPQAMASLTIMVLRPSLLCTYWTASFRGCRNAKEALLTRRDVSNRRGGRACGSHSGVLSLATPMVVSRHESIP